MRKLLIVLAIFLACSTARAQQGNALVLSFSGAPTGTCSFMMFANDTTNGNMYFCDQTSHWKILAGGGGGGTVTNFTAGTLSPLFTTSVATSSITPALSFALTNAAAYTLFGNVTGAPAGPSYNSMDTLFGSCSGATDAHTYNITTHAFGCHSLAASNAATTVNGATCTLGSTCNVNGTNTANTVALNAGAGSALGATVVDSTTTHALFATAGAPAFRRPIWADIDKTTSSVADITTRTCSTLSDSASGCSTAALGLPVSIGNGGTGNGTTVTAHYWFGNNTAGAAAPAFARPACADLSDAGAGCTGAGGGGPGTGTQYAAAYFATTTTLGSVAPPTTKGFWNVGYNLSTDAAIAPVAYQAGLTNRTVTGTTSTDALLFTDNLNRVEYTGSVAVATSLATPTTLENTHFAVRLANHTTGSATAVTLTPTTWTVNGASTLVIGQGQVCTISVGAGTDWSADCGVRAIDCTGTGHVLAISTGGVPSCSADGGGGTGIYSTMFGIGLNRGSNLTPAFLSTNYTKSHWTEGAGSMAIAYTGANSFTPATPVSCVIGQTYQFDLVLSAWTSGTFTLTACGVTSVEADPGGPAVFRFYITATGTTSPSISAAASGAQAMTFSSFTMKRAAFDATSLANINVIIDTNSGLAVPLVVNQPPALVGWQYQEYVIAPYAVYVLTANGTDTWEWGTSSYTGVLGLAAVRQTFLTLVSFANGYWDIAGLNGSVTPN